MLKTILPLEENNYKCAAFDEDQFLYSTEMHRDYGQLVASLKAKSLLEKTISIPYDDILGLSVDSESNRFVKIVHKKANGKETSTNVNFSQSASKAAFESYLIEKLNMVRSTREKVNWSSRLLNVGLSPLFFACAYYFRILAIDAQNGKHHEVSGRRKGMEKMLMNFHEFIGPTATFLLWSSVGAWILYSGIKSWNVPVVADVWTRVDKK